MKEKEGKQEAAVESNFIQDRKRTKGPNSIRQLHLRNSQARSEAMNGHQGKSRILCFHGNFGRLGEVV
jgi:hypothetical protein